MSKLDFPKLVGELTPASIHGWLGRCEDTLEAWEAINSEKTIAPKVIITLAGLKMEEATAATWWSENRTELKALGSWAEFAGKVKARFVPSNWRMAALATFYSIQQGPTAFPAFAKALVDARNVLASAGAGYTINDSMMKNHLLFYAHPILRLRISGQHDLPFVTMTVDSLISTMSSTWESLVAERVIRPSAPAPTPLTIPSTLLPSSSSLPTPTSAASSASSRPAPLSAAEKETLRAANGCFNCRKSPLTPGWVKHRFDNCPGDPALGIPPRSTPAVIAAVAPVAASSADNDSDVGYGYGPITAVMPAYDPNDVYDPNDSSDDDSY
ncbi:hypothetical protein B0H16DRAFT_1798178 [Mycena metata]|uniref:Retrotransposon gag domain-containing protein n=1 Tax=Mycena metata TaxID=1033252 RepID=A0AAD7JJQ4_9AGAR|nr:hypothetical protein B0H16DRAFT_1798178 [Mycena metata]